MQMAQKKRNRSVHIPVNREEDADGPRKDEAPGGKPGRGDEGEVPAEKETPDRPEAKEGAPDVEALEKKAAEYDSLLDTLQRLKAEYANYQKRIEREREEWRETCVRDVLVKILPVIDNLERAVEAAGGRENGGDLLSGVELILKQFRGVLAAEGVTAFESRGAKFDPRYHEALMVEEKDDVPPDTVLAEVQRGYMFGEKVLRAARVSVSRRPAAKEEPLE
jgi:molecular chaperone GrpE